MSVVARPLALVHLCISFEIGGTERLVTDMLRTLKVEKTANPMLIIVNDLFDQRLVSELERAGVPVLLLRRAPGSRSPGPFLRLASAIRGMRPEVLHVHDAVSQALAFALKILNPQLKLFTTVHNTGLAPRYRAWRIAAANLLNMQFIGVSKAVAAECATRGLRQVRSITNGIDLSRFAQPRPIATLGRPFRLLCVARLVVHQKGQDVLLRALRLCVDGGLDMHLTLMGGAEVDPTDDRGLLHHLARELEIEDRVKFIHGQLDVPQELARADLFVLPSRFEGFGMAAVEAMAAGLAVVASQVGGLAEIVSPGETGLLVPAEDPAALADAIIRLASDPATRARLERNGRIIAATHGLHAMNQAYLDAYLGE